MASFCLPEFLTVNKLCCAGVRIPLPIHAARQPQLHVMWQHRRHQKPGEMLEKQPEQATRICTALLPVGLAMPLGFATADSTAACCSLAMQWQESKAAQ